MAETNIFRYLTIGMLLVLLLVVFRFFSFNTRYDEMKTEIDFRSKDGFDQNLINRVDKLERELNERASFGYKGNKDPFAGRTRNVALPKKRKIIKATISKKKDEVVKVEDEIILMATILDGKKAGAIIMINDRSYTVNVGDVVEKRKIILIQKGFIKFRLNRKDYTLKF